jgi:hypothetical protein
MRNCSIFWGVAMRARISRTKARFAVSIVIAGLVAFLASPIQSQSLGGDFRNTTIRVAKGTDGDMAFEVQRGDDGNPSATGGATVKRGDTVAFDRNGHLKTNTAGWWKPIGDGKYRVVIYDPNRKGLMLIELQGEVRWDSHRNVVKGADNFLRLTTSTIDKFVEITKRETRNDRLVVTAKNGSVYSIYGLSCDFTATGLRVQAAH